MRAFRDLTRRARSFAGRFLESTSGNTAMIFGLVAVTVIMAGGAGIDVARAVSMKTRLSSALDAAALAVGTQLDMNEDQLEAMAQKYFDANYPSTALGTTTAVQLTQNGEKISLSVTGQVDTTLLKIININQFDLSVANEVTRSANNIEVGLVLDITGSMCLPNSGCTKIADLKTAAKDLVDMIVQDVQTPYYTKLALVPYSSSVNVGGYADSIRGSTTAAKSITAVEWQNTSFAAKTITAVTKANPAVVTSTAHGLVAGDKIWLSGITGMTQLNNKPYIVGTVVNANSFQLKGWNSGSTSFTNLDTTSGYSTFTAGANAIKKCIANTTSINGCELQVTSNGHGFSNGNRVVIKNIVASTGGSTAQNAVINDTTDTNDANTTAGDTDGKRATWAISSVATNTFRIPAYMPSGTNPTWVYSSAGLLYCTTLGCQYHRFTTQTSVAKVFPISTCVSERSGTDAYTDTSPATAPLGRVYPASPEPPASANNPCITPTIIPLSTDKADLKAKIDAMTTSGSTAGHLGAAWGWYMVSPNFKTLWPTASQPADYGADHLFKVVILMTDGEFNTFYCNGVISQDSANINNYSEDDDHKNCNGPNGGAFAQAQSLCAAMKASPNNVIVYTVGFDIGDDENAQDIISQCATDTEHAYYPETGAQLKADFAHIAQEISQLRLSQ